MDLLQISRSNTKLDWHKKEYGTPISTFSLPAGSTCPGAKECKAWVKWVEGKEKPLLHETKETEFRCFSANTEVRFKKTWLARKKNMDSLKKAYQVGGVGGVGDLITASISKSLTRAQRAGESIVRIRPHVSGDFFSAWYFEAWLNVAEQNPNWEIYFYTKSINFLVEHKARLNALQNVSATCSIGGKHDHLIEESGFKTARVVYSVAEAESLGLEIDKKDNLAMDRNGKNFALLLHGTQSPGSAASKALSEIKETGRLAILQPAQAAQTASLYSQPRFTPL